MLARVHHKLRSAVFIIQFFDQIHALHKKRNIQILYLFMHNLRERVSIDMRNAQVVVDFVGHDHLSAKRLLLEYATIQKRSLRIERSR